MAILAGWTALGGPLREYRTPDGATVARRQYMNAVARAGGADNAYKVQAARDKQTLGASRGSKAGRAAVAERKAERAKVKEEKAALPKPKKGNKQELPGAEEKPGAIDRSLEVQIREYSRRSAASDGDKESRERYAVDIGFESYQEFRRLQRTALYQKLLAAHVRQTGETVDYAGSLYSDLSAKLALAAEGGFSRTPGSDWYDLLEEYGLLDEMDHDY